MDQQESKIEKLANRVALAHLGGGEDRIAKQHAKKKLTARERINYLMDEGSFEEMGVLVTHRTTDFGMENEQYYRRWCDNGLWHHKWKARVCFCTGFYRFWRCTI